MKSLFIVAVFAWLSLVSADRQSEFFNRISASEFGQTVIETLQLELGQDNSVARIQNLLQSMLADVESDQGEADKTVKARQQTCQTKVAEIDSIVTRASQKRAEDEQQLPLKQEELQDKQRQAEDKNEEEQRNNDKISLLVTDRKETRSAYEQRRDELTGLVVTLKEAKQIIGQLAPGSFLSVREDIFTEIKDHFKSFQKHYPSRRGFNPLVTLLLETAQDPAIRADADLVGKVLTVFDDLVDSLYEVQKSEMLADDARGQAFQLAKARLELANRNLAQSIATLDAAVQTLAQKLLEFNNDIATQIQIVDTKTTEKGDWLKTCNDEKVGYDRQTANRNEERDIISQTISIFENGLSKEARASLAEIKI